MREELLRMERVTYREHGEVRLENFSISVFSGEILGLVPVDRYGISAMLKLMRQNLPLHYGYVYYREKLVNHWKYPSMSRNRIGIISNKSCLADDLTVADNIFVLRPGFKKRIIQPEVLRAQLEPFLREIDIDLSSDACVETLTPFERFVTELLKAVVAGYYLDVLEDIGTFISDRELDKLHSILRHYARKGMAFVYITSHMEEARQICDRMALMTNGQIIKYFRQDDGVPDEFFYHLEDDFGSIVKEQIGRRPEMKRSSHIVFQMDGADFGSIRNLSFSVMAGECLVIQDLDNCMIQDFLTLLCGDGKTEKGALLLNGGRLKKRLDRRLAIVQEAPAETMIFPSMSYSDNLCFTLDHRHRKVWITNGVKKSLRQEMAGVLGADSFEKNIGDLAEIEKYDLVYTRILLQNPDIVFCVQPFKRAELSVRRRVWELLERFLNKGIAVVILSVNLADALALADRLIRISRGKNSVELSREEFAYLPDSTPWISMYQKESVYFAPKVN